MKKTNEQIAISDTVKHMFKIIAVLTILIGPIMIGGMLGRLYAPFHGTEDGMVLGFIFTCTIILLFNTYSYVESVYQENLIRVKMEKKYGKQKQ